MPKKVSTPRVAKTREKQAEAGIVRVECRAHVDDRPKIKALERRLLAKRGLVR